MVGAAPSESSPINNTYFRRLLTLTAIKFLKRLRPRRGIVPFLSSKLCVKYGSFQHLSKAATIQFIAQHTSTPVPKVCCAFKHRKWTYIVMERLDGEMLCRGWSMGTTESKARIFKPAERDGKRNAKHTSS
jgi:hypothetical protein